jgi:hypothetical protein
MEPMEEILYTTVFAAEQHKHQRRKGDNSSYICHPLRVAQILSLAHVRDKNVLMAAILHDTIEDTPTTYEDIRVRYGKQVADIVMEVTDDKQLSKLERKKLQVSHTRNSNMSYEAKLIKLADKIDNCRDLLKVRPVGWTEEDVTDYFVWSYEVVEPCLKLNKRLRCQFLDVYRSYFSSGNIIIAPESEDLRHQILDRYYQKLSNIT